MTIAPYRLLTLGLIVGLFLLASSFSSIAFAASQQQLVERVHAFLYEQTRDQGEEVVIEVYPSSAQLPPCDDPAPFLVNGSRQPMGRVSVGVRCGETGRQVRYLQAEVSIMGSYPVLARDLGAGDMVTPEHLSERRGNLADLPRNTILAADTLVGQIATRSLRAGRPLQKHQLRPLPLVERGESVIVEARGTSFRVTREGQALDDGGKGERVRVRFGSRELITATVVGKDRLAVDF